MTLLYITNGINGPGGLERVLSIKASHLADQYGYNVHVLVLNNAHTNPFYEFSSTLKFHSIEVGGNPINYFNSYKNGIQKIVDQIQPHIISVCDDGLKGFFLPNIIKTHAKWIYERHVSKLIEAKENHSFMKKLSIRFKWYVMEFLGKKFDRFIVLTEKNKNEWKSLKNMQVIVNPLSFVSDSVSKLNNKIVICVGKISYQKGQDILIKAWEFIHKNHPDWELHLYGKENLDFLDTNNLKNNVHFFPPVKDIENKYLESSTYVMSSRFEGFGMVLIEAMEFGLPCVSFDCNYGPSDIITDDVDGYLVEKENYKELARQINTLIENKELRKSMGAKAKENVKRYSQHEIVKQWDELFKTLKAQ